MARFNIDQLTEEKQTELLTVLKDIGVVCEIKNNRLFLPHPRLEHEVTGRNDFTNVLDALEYVDPNSMYWNRKDEDETTPKMDLFL